MTPLISIVTPTYNRAHFLSAMTQSVQAQTYQNWDLWIIDDGSTDDTREVVERLAHEDSRIHYLHKVNGGQGSARNLGIAHSQGTFVAFLDSDDLWLPEKLEKQIRILQENPGYDFCYTADIERLIPGDASGSYRDKIVRVEGSDRLSEKKRAGLPTSVPSSHLYRRDALKRVGSFDENPDLKGLEDNDWSLRGHSLKGFYLDEPLTIYQIHASQITQLGYKTERYETALAYIIQKNIEILNQFPEALVFRVAQLTHIALLRGDPRKARSYLSRWSGVSRSRTLRALWFFSFLPRFLYRWLDAFRRALR